MAEFKFEIVKQIGAIGQRSSKGWQKEINLISWNDAAPKLDIREWSEDHSKMGKGVTLSKDEAANLLNLLKQELD